MYRVMTGGLLSALAAFAIATGANALSGPVLKSGNTYHRAACAPTVGHVAHCHAHVVTDADGKPLVKANPNVSGYSPANLRDAYKVTGTGNSSTIVAIVDA